MWNTASLACPNFLGGAAGDGNMSGKAFSMASECFTVKNKINVIWLTAVRYTIIMLMGTQPVITFVLLWCFHDLFEHSIKLCILIKSPPAGLQVRYEVRVENPTEIENPMQFIHDLK